MHNKNKVGFSPLKVVIIVLLAIIIAISIAVNAVFLKSNTTHDMFGKTLFLMETDEMMPEITKNTMIIAEKDKLTSLQKGDVALYNYINTENKTISALSRIHDIVIKTDGIYYNIKSDATEGTETITVSEKDIIAKGSLSSKELGVTVATLKSTLGIALFLILPSIILILLIITSSINARKLKDGGLDDYDMPVMLERMPKKKKRVSTPLFETDDDINSSEDFLEKKNSISENFSQKRVNRNSPYQNIDAQQRRAKTDEAQKKVLFEVSDDDAVEGAKRKVNERLKDAEEFEPQSDFYEYKQRNAKAMTSSKRNATDERVKFVSQANNNSNTNTSNNVDEKANAIKLALQKRTFDDAGETDSTYMDNSPKPTQPVQAVEKKAPKATSKMDDVKNRYLNQSKKNTSTSTGSATFEDLMKVLESEKKKLD